jgi:hypothetical protein
MFVAVSVGNCVVKVLGSNLNQFSINLNLHSVSSQE